MTIVHIERPAGFDPSAFETFMPPPVGDLPRPTLGSVESWAAPDGAVETGTWEATPGTFARAIVDAEFCHFVRGRATFVTEDGRRFEFRAGDAAYFPPRTLGLWTIHETLRKTYLALTQIRKSAERRCEIGGRSATRLWMPGLPASAAIGQLLSPH
jgi:uncharacterized protein